MDLIEISKAHISKAKSFAELYRDPYTNASKPQYGHQGPRPTRSPIASLHGYSGYTPSHAPGYAQGTPSSAVPKKAGIGSKALKLLARKA